MVFIRETQLPVPLPVQIPFPMKFFSMLSLTLGAALAISSCGNDSEYGRSTQLDSTKNQGTAPVDYSAGRPTQTTDTHQVSPSGEAAVEARQQAQQSNDPNGPTSNSNGANTSNTTDRTTTSGSANNGDADGDRKR